MFLLNLFRKKRPRTNSSIVYREFYYPRLLPILLEEGVKEAAIKEIHWLTFTLRNDKNIRIINACLDNSDWKGLARVIQKVPVDFDETDYPIIEVLYVMLGSGQFIYLVGQDEQCQKMECIGIRGIDTINLDAFMSRMRIYPV